VRPGGTVTITSVPIGPGTLGPGVAIGPAVGLTGGVIAPSRIASIFGPAAGRKPAAGPTKTPTHRTTHRPTKPTVPSRGPSVISRFVNVVPTEVWIALGGALLLAALATSAAIASGYRARVQAGRIAAVSAAALTDALTGVLNRRGFIDAAERELARARRYGRPFVLAFVDVRGLKAVNDSEGHLAGDELLRQVAELLKDSARADDVVGRLGGDELGLLLPEQSAEGAARVIGRIRARVPDRRNHLGLSAPWDLTIGIAAFPADGHSVDELLDAADRRLYQQRGISLR
jgi:diguanylate cyclase (GGDEF)-like protein